MNRFSLSILVVVVISIFMGANPLVAKTFKKALPGYKYKFPLDHGSHNEFKTEWWYYTGHLDTEDGLEYGFELTFFRTATDSTPSKTASAWKLDNIYLAHFAVTDLPKKKFNYFQKLNRYGLGLADARADIPYVFNEQWSMKFLDDKTISLTAKDGVYAMDLLLNPAKQPVIHGINGVSQKASCAGCASHYYSLSRLDTRGLLFVDGKPHKVKGLAWMDHEFGSNQLTEEQVGWDWFSIQLDDQREMMLYVMRKADGSIDSNSSGTLIESDGKSKHLSKGDFVIKPSKFWKSQKSGGNYPVGWTISIPSSNIELEVSSLLDDQELVTGKSTQVTYWEGAAHVKGRQGDRTLKGRAYIEMTGYANKFKKRI